MYDLLIIGGGPGGVAAGIYAARKKIKSILVTEGFGGQSAVSSDIQNWIGFKSVSGFELAKMLEDHLKAQEGIEVMEGDKITLVGRNGGNFVAKTREGKEIETKYILVASGSDRRRLNIPGEKDLDGKGVVYCSTCDAPIFKDKKIVVVGGGNAGLEAVLDSLLYALDITLLERGEKLKGDEVTQEKIRKEPKVKIATNAQITEILGNGFVSGIKYKDVKTGEEKEISTQGVFVEIGSTPNAQFLNGLAELNPLGEIIVDHKTQRTSCPGIWAIGDVTDVLYKQNNISVGDAIKAVLNINEEINKNSN